MTTPSYNSLGFQALLICSIGLLRAEKMPTRSSLIGWSLIALGGWLAFMAKPSTALALAIGIFGCLIVSRKASLPMLAVAVAIAIMLLVLSAIYIDGSVTAFANRVALGLEYARLMGGGHDLANVFRLDEFYLHKRGKFFIFVVLVGSCLGMWGVLTKTTAGACALPRGLYMPLSCHICTLPRPHHRHRGNGRVPRAFDVRSHAGCYG